MTYQHTFCSAMFADVYGRFKRTAISSIFGVRDTFGGLSVRSCGTVVGKVRATTTKGVKVGDGAWIQFGR